MTIIKMSNEMPVEVGGYYMSPLVRSTLVHCWINRPEDEETEGLIVRWVDKETPLHELYANGWRFAGPVRVEGYDYDER